MLSKWTIDQVNDECKLPRNADYTTMLQPIMKALTQVTDQFFFIRVNKDSKLFSQLTITSKGYYYKIIQHNT